MTQFADWLGIDDEGGFGIDNLPLGIFSTPGSGPRTGVAVGDRVLDLAALTDEAMHATGTLNAFLSLGPRAWADLRGRLTDALSTGSNEREVAQCLHARRDATMHLPIEVADYVDFFSSQHHAENLGAILRPGTPALTPNWKHLPIGYHGRAGTVRVSGTPVVRPAGQRRTADEPPVFGPTQRLDIEAEVGFVVGVPSAPGVPVAVDSFTDHVFGVCLVNDWSARDIQAWEYAPLGPFLGKSFQTSMSPWVVPLAALEAARIRPPARDPQVLPYLRDDASPWGLDIALEVRLNGETVSRPQFAGMYWTPAQQLAHLTVNGASTRTGDLFASGTVSGPQRDQRGSLVELSWNGADPFVLADGSTRTFLEDGDEVVITATAPSIGGGRISFGEVAGKILPGNVEKSWPPPSPG